MSDSRNPRGVFDHLRLLFTFGVIYTHAVRFIDQSNHNELCTLLFGIQSGMGFGVGDLCVDGFFGLSGFLIMGAWIRNPSVADFVRNRFLRLYPGFVVASLLCLSLFAAMAVPDYGIFLGSLSPWHVLKELATLSGPWEPVYAGTRHPYANGSTWTLHIEVELYTVVALTGFIWRSRAAMLRVWWMFLVAGVILIVLFNSLSPLKGWFLSGGDFLLRFFSCFAVGALCKLHEPFLNSIQRWWTVTAFLFLVSMFFERLLPISVPVLLPLLVIQIGRSRFLARMLPSLSCDLSYGTFLYGWPVQKVLIHMFPAMGVIVHICFVVPITLAFAWLSWRLVEAPFLRLKSNGVRNALAAELSA